MSENTNLKIALGNAIDLFNNNNLNECIEQLEEILTIHPANLKVLNMLLDTYIKINKAAEALKIIKKLIRLEPNKKEHQYCSYLFLILSYMTLQQALIFLL